MIFTYIRSRRADGIDREIAQLEDMKSKINRLADENMKNGFEYEAQKLLEYGARYVTDIDMLMKKKAVI
jgi:hypothetical protein